MTDNICGRSDNYNSMGEIRGVVSTNRASGEIQGDVSDQLTAR